jgi:hypothetical protein
MGALTGCLAVAALCPPLAAVAALWPPLTAKHEDKDIRGQVKERSNKRSCFGLSDREATETWKAQGRVQLQTMIATRITYSYDEKIP